jgi:hypothetical protein
MQTQAAMPAEVQMALGRMFRLMSRPSQPGDMEQYEACRRVLLDASEGATPDYAPNYARDRFLGAQGDAA